MKSRFKHILLLLLLCCLLPLSGCSSGEETPKTHDSKSLEALPYTLYGENDYWIASCTISAVSESEKQKQQENLNTIEERFGGEDSSAYQQQQQYSPAYTAVFSLTFKGNDKQLEKISKYTVTFAKDTPYEKKTDMQRNSGQKDFEEKISGKTPLWTAIFAEDAAVLGEIPPVSSVYELEIKTSGYKEANSTLTMQYKP